MRLARHNPTKILLNRTNTAGQRDQFQLGKATQFALWSARAASRRQGYSSRFVIDWGARTSRVLVSASRRNNLLLWKDRRVCVTVVKESARRRGRLRQHARHPFDFAANELQAFAG